MPHDSLILRELFRAKMVDFIWSSWFHRNICGATSPVKRGPLFGPRPANSKRYWTCWAVSFVFATRCLSLMALGSGAAWEAFEKLLKKSRAACVGWMSSDGDLYPFDLWHYMHASKARRSRSGGNWCQPPTRLVFTQPYLHQAAPKHSRDRRLLKCDLGRLYDVIVYLTYPIWFVHII